MRKKLLLGVAICISIQNFAQDCVEPTAQINFDYNIFNASVILGEQLFTGDTDNLGLEVPSGDGRSMVYSSEFWISSLTPEGQINMAAGPGDFYAGPLTTDTDLEPYIEAGTCEIWDQFFVAYLTDSELHLEYYNAVVNGTEEEDFPDGYTIPDYFLTYPGNGLPGQLPLLAPYYDFDNDGSYIPENGDCPLFDSMIDQSEGSCQNCNALGGDVSVFWITNDMGGDHLSSGGLKLGVEIHNNLYAFINSDNGLENTLFLKKKIINRGTQTFSDFNVGYMMDTDLGNYSDDYVGCDIDRHLVYVYNGDSFDEDISGALGYGENPPLFGVMSLTGYLDPSGEVEDEPLDGFIAFNPGSMGINGVPETVVEKHKTLNSLWKSGAIMTCGDDGTNDFGQTTSYIFPGESGTSACLNWSEISAGIGSGDRRILVNENGDNFEPGDEQCYHYAFLYAEEDDEPAFQELLQLSDEVSELVFDCYGAVSSVDDIQTEVLNYAWNDHTAILSVDGYASVRVFDLLGQLVADKNTRGEPINLRFLNSGIYIIQIIDDNYNSVSSRIRVY